MSAHQLGDLVITRMRALRKAFNDAGRVVRSILAELELALDPRDRDLESDGPFHETVAEIFRHFARPTVRPIPFVDLDEFVQHRRKFAGILDETGESVDVHGGVVPRRHRR